MPPREPPPPWLPPPPCAQPPAQRSSCPAQQRCQRLPPPPQRPLLQPLPSPQRCRRASCRRRWPAQPCRLLPPPPAARAAAGAGRGRRRGSPLGGTRVPHCGTARCTRQKRSCNRPWAPAAGSAPRWQSQTPPGCCPPASTAGGKRFHGQGQRRRGWGVPQQERSCSTTSDSPSQPASQPASRPAGQQASRPASSCVRTCTAPPLPRGDRSSAYMSAQPEVLLPPPTMNQVLPRMEPAWPAVTGSGRAIMNGRAKAGQAEADS